MRWLAVVLLALAAAGCARRQSGPSCRSAEGIALLFEPKNGSPRAAQPSLAEAVASAPDAQLVVGDKVLAVLLPGQKMDSFERAKTDILARARSADLEFTVEDRASIDETCTIRLRDARAGTDGGVVSPGR